MQRIQESALEEQGAEYRVRNTAARMEVILAGEVVLGNEQRLEAGVLGSALSKGSTSLWASPDMAYFRRAHGYLPALQAVYLIYALTYFAWASYFCTVAGKLHPN